MTMPSMARSELARGAVAGVNGGYFLPRPQGVPNGLYVERGRMVAGRSVGGDGKDTGDPTRADREYRAIAGIQPNGAIVADRLKVALTLDLHGRTGIVVDEINRHPLSTQTDTLITYDHRFGSTVVAPAGSVVLVVDELALGSTGRVAGNVRARYDAASTMSFVANDARWPAGTSLLVATGTRAVDVVDAVPGTSVGLTSTITPDVTSAAAWTGLRGAIPGAGLLLRNGSIPSATSMSAEGINHASSRRARTAVGRLANGHTILVTTRESSVSAGDGITLHELARVLRELEVTDAVALDGGGSTHMTVNGATFNRPSQVDRGHSSALFVYAPVPPAPREPTRACPSGQVPNAGFVDTAGNVHRPTIDCLAWWGVTQGVTATRFEPAGTVSRAQMAAFLARWVDRAAAEPGTGQPLPATASNPFTDVLDTHVHVGPISRLAAVGIVQGRSATTYDPSGSVTRAETATLLRRAIEYSRRSELPAGRDTFVDDNGSSHEPNIDKLAGQAIVSGVGGFSYSPSAPVTRAAMASMISRASDLMVTEGITSPPGS
jgi:hypothetical protein